MQVIKQQTSVTDESVRGELKKILASPGFFRASRMQRFLTFVVEGRLAGKHQSDELKESVIGMSVFDRDADYDPKSDPVVRVEARRLRSKLDEYYEETGKGDAVRIQLPKGSYVPSWDWQGDPVSVVEERPSAPGKRRSPRWWVAATGMLLALILVIASSVIASRSDWRERLLAGRYLGGGGKIRSLAVLPFRNLSSDPKQEFLISGLTDEIITELAKIKKLTVISRTSTESYKMSNKRLPEIARELHVDAIVEGTFRTAGNRVRVTAQLIRGATDSHLWAETYERDAADMFTLQSEMAQDIAEEIGVTLSPPTGSESAERPSNWKAYEAYLRGRYFWNKRTLEGLRKSIGYYEQAVGMDAHYASAYAGLADSYVSLSSYGGPSPAESLGRAREAAEKALRLDGGLAQAYTALAAVKIDYDWDWRGATREFQRALELSPSYPTAHHWFALHLSRLGRHKEAEGQIERALRLDPLSLIINTDAGEVFNYARDTEGALAHLHRALELDPDFAEAHLVMGKVYEQRGDFGRALKEFDTANRLFGDAPNVWALQGSALARAGRRQEALAMARKLEGAATGRYVSGVDIAIVYCGLGDQDRVMEWLEKAYRNRDKGLDIIAADPLFDGCRPDARFRDLVRRLHLG